MTTIPSNPTNPACRKSTVVDPEKIKARDAAETFAKQYWDDGIQSIGNNKKEGKWCIHVKGTETALAKIPIQLYEFDGNVYEVVKEVGSGERTVAVKETIIGGAAFIESPDSYDYDQVKKLHVQFCTQISKLSVAPWESVFDKASGKWRFYVTVTNQADYDKVYDDCNGIEVVKNIGNVGLQKEKKS